MIDPVDLSRDPFAAFVVLLHENSRHEEAIEYCEQRLIEQQADESPDITVQSDTATIEYSEYKLALPVQHDPHDGPMVRSKGWAMHLPTDTEFKTEDEFGAELARDIAYDQWQGESMRDAARAAWYSSRGI